MSRSREKHSRGTFCFAMIWSCPRISNLLIKVSESIPVGVEQRPMQNNSRSLSHMHCVVLVQTVKLKALSWCLLRKWQKSSALASATSLTVPLWLLISFSEMGELFSLLLRN